MLARVARDARRTRSATAVTAPTYAAWVPNAVAIMLGGHRHGGGVRPSSGNIINVAVMSVAPKA
jgi:hypothetical protein